MLADVVKNDEMREQDGLQTGKLQWNQGFILHSLKWLGAVLAKAVRKDD